MVDTRDREPEARLGEALAELGRAERTSGPPPSWAALAARLERPHLVDRAPIALAAAARAGSVLLQPAAAGAVAATLAGLGLGTWLALSWQRASTTTADASLYQESSLLADEAGGLAARYFTLGGDPAVEESSPGAGVADSGGAVR